MTESNYHTTKWLLEDLLETEIKKTKVKMNKPVYLALLILEISTLINEFCNNYNTPRYQNNGKIFYVDTSSFIVYTRTEDIADDVQNRYDISSYEVDRPLPKGMNKKVIGQIKDEVGGKIITEFLHLDQNHILT